MKVSGFLVAAVAILLFTLFLRTLGGMRPSIASRGEGPYAVTSAKAKTPPSLQDDLNARASSSVEQRGEGRVLAEVEAKVPGRDSIESILDSTTRDRLHRMALEDFVAEARARVLFLTKDAFDPYWSSEQYEVLEQLDSKSLVDGEGRPKLMQTRIVNGELRAVILNRAEYGEAYLAFDNLYNLQVELDALTSALGSRSLSGFGD